MSGEIRNRVAVEKVRRLAAELLDQASDQFANHGCNDLAKPSYFTAAEWRTLAEDYERWNSNGQDPPLPLADFVAMSWCAALLAKGLI